MVEDSAEEEEAEESIWDPQPEASDDSEDEDIDLEPRYLRIVDERTGKPIKFKFEAHPQCVSRFLYFSHAHGLT